MRRQYELCELLCGRCQTLVRCRSSAWRILPSTSKLPDAAQNEVLAGMLRSIRTLVTVWIRRVVTAERDLAELTREHVAILEAVEAQDPIAAAEAMEEHLTTVIHRLSDGLEAQRLAEAIPTT